MGERGKAHRLFRRRGCVNGKRHSGFSRRGRLYRQSYAYPPETIISHSFYLRHPDIFFDFYRHRMLYPNAKPNIVHMKLAQWEKEGKLLAVVTQNIDGLHQMAGEQERL